MCKVQLTEKNAILNSKSYKEDFGSINAELRGIKLDFGFNQKAEKYTPWKDKIILNSAIIGFLILFIHLCFN